MKTLILKEFKKWVGVKLVKIEEHTIKYGDKNIDLKIVRKRVKNINLHVKNDLSVVISAHPEISTAYILDFARKKASWIEEKLEQFRKVKVKNPKKISYENGDIFKYLGKDYELQVLQTKAKEGVIDEEGYLYLLVKDQTDVKRKERLIKAWYKKRADEVFLRSLERVYPYVKDYGFSKPTLRSRAMKARWGSCLIWKKDIILNRALIEYPLVCIDYVMLHELTHLKYKYHDKDFYGFMTKIMPDWKTVNDLLNKHARREA